ncbi:MAG: NADP-dependent malic enzyme [Bacteroidota bacterium]|nr:NADP-dependent malic enzyme [Bacteroidota bacterium]
MDKLKNEALAYHANGRPGKIEVVPTKPYATQRDLGLAYTPGVASPCLAIKDNKEDVYKYTAKSNLVAVISNGTAVLGLGDIGPEAGKPVMEGKGLLFKIFADIDVFDIEVDASNIDLFVNTVKAIAPTFGGINLEDIKAPECFEIEERLKAELDIPVMHDDQHGTAIISAAGLLNALELAGKKIDNVKIVVNGAGAAAVTCTKLYKSLGAKAENIMMCDSKGVIHTERKNLNKEKLLFARETPLRTLAEAMVGADVFLGLSVAGVLTKEMVQSMAANPIVFALANPDPEIPYEEAKASREDLIFATGRSDYPNQINNVLGFPFIFRGALDVRARCINEEMKIACVHALAKLAKEKVPESVHTAYNASNIVFGREYLIPKPMDPRLITRVAPAVAKAAIDSGVARVLISDWAAYEEELSRRLGSENKLISLIENKAKGNPKRVAFPEASEFNVLRAAHIALKEGMATPVLIGNAEKIRRLIAENDFNFDGIEIIDNRSREKDALRRRYAEMLYQKRQRKGMTLEEAVDKMFDKNYFAAMMVECGDADAAVTGYETRYAEAIRPVVEVIGKKEGISKIFGMHIVITPKGTFFLADTSMGAAPDSDVLVDTTLQAASVVRRFNMKPRIALLSYSNFGSQKEGTPSIVHKAVETLHRDYPDMIVEGEMQLKFALDKELRTKMYGFNRLNGYDVNTLIFPNLSSANIAMEVLKHISGYDTLGPVLVGNRKSMHVMQMGSAVRDILNMIAIAVIDAQSLSGK